MCHHKIFSGSIGTPPWKISGGIIGVLTSCLSDDAGMRMASDRTLYIPATIWLSLSCGMGLLSAIDFITSLQSLPSRALTTARHTTAMFGSFTSWPLLIALVPNGYIFEALMSRSNNLCNVVHFCNPVQCLCPILLNHSDVSPACVFLIAFLAF